MIFQFLGILNENIWIGGQIRSSFNNYGFTNFEGTGMSALVGFQIFENLSLGYSTMAFLQMKLVMVLVCQPMFF